MSVDLNHKSGFQYIPGGSSMSIEITPSNTDEEWRIPLDYAAYEVSNLGRVRRIHASGRWEAGHVLRPGTADSGHLYVYLTGNNGKAQKQYVHRLVAISFVGPSPFDGALVLHHDDVSANNVASNLYWGTHAQNVIDAKLNRKSPREVSQQGAQLGEANSSAVLTETNVRAIRRFLRIGLCGACIARIFQVNKETIYSIAKGRTWTHVQEEAT